MALRPDTFDYTFSATGPVLLRTIMAVPANTWIQSVTLRAHRNNVGDVSWTGTESGQVGGYIGASEAVVMDFGEGQALVRNFSLIGTSGDRVYITVGRNWWQE